MTVISIGTLSNMTELTSGSQTIEIQSVSIPFECWRSSRNFFQGGGKIYCYANFFCYAIVYEPNFMERQSLRGEGRGKTASGGAPCPSLWKKARIETSVDRHVFLTVSSCLRSLNLCRPMFHYNNCTAKMFLRLA